MPGSVGKLKSETICPVKCDPIGKGKRGTMPAAKAKKCGGRKWSAKVTETSDALSLEESVFKRRSAKAIAESLKRSADASKRRKGTPLQSAMSMLNFYINRAGKTFRKLVNASWNGPRMSCAIYSNRTRARSAIAITQASSLFRHPGILSAGCLLRQAGRLFDGSGRDA